MKRPPLILASVAVWLGLLGLCAWGYFRWSTSVLDGKYTWTNVSLYRGNEAGTILVTFYSNPNGTSQVDVGCEYAAGTDSSGSKVEGADFAPLLETSEFWLGDSNAHRREPFASMGVKETIAAAKLMVYDRIVIASVTEWGLTLGKGTAHYRKNSLGDFVVHDTQGIISPQVGSTVSRRDISKVVPVPGVMVLVGVTFLCAVMGVGVGRGSYFTFVSLRRAHRRREGVCTECGYASEKGRMCPECGALPRL